MNRFGLRYRVVFTPIDSLYYKISTITIPFKEKNLRGLGEGGRLSPGAGHFYYLSEGLRYSHAPLQVCSWML